MLGAVALALRAIWWRKGASMVVLVVAVFACGTAAAGPLFLQGASESILRDTLSTAPTTSAGTGAEMTKDASGTSGSGPLETAVALAMPSAVADVYRTRVTSLERPTRIVDAAGRSEGRITVVHRQQVCGHLRLTAGRCIGDGSSGEIIVSAVDARRLAWSVGQIVRIDAFQDASGGAESTVRPMRIVGLYQPVDPNGGYWFNDTRGYFDGVDRRRDEAERQPAGNRTLEAAFVGSGAFQGLTASSAVQVIVVEDLLLDPHAVTRAAMPGLREGLDAFGVRLRQAGLSEGYYSASVINTQVRQVLDRADSAAAAMRLTLVVVSVELVLLGLFVLFIVVAGAAETRSGEVALAKLRGLPTLTTFSFGMLETVLLLLMAAPIGALIALSWLNSAAGTLFGTGLGVHASPAMWAAVALTAGGGLVAGVLASLRSLRQSVTEQWRRTKGQRALRTAAFEAAVLSLTAAALWQQWRAAGSAGPPSGGQPDVLALVAPTLFAFAAALIAGRAVPLLAALTGNGIRRSRHVGLFIGTRELARRPGGTRLLVVLTTAFALATFSIVGAGVFAANRSDRARTETGADRVVLVDPYSPVDLRSVVARLDPSGTHAMAVAQLTSSVFGAFSADSGEGSGPSRDPFTLLVVDPRRLTATAFWRPDFAGSSLTSLARLLSKPFTRPPSWQGDRLRIAATAHLACCGATALTAVADDPQGRTIHLGLGQIREGPQAFTAATPQCAQARCVLRRLEITRRDPGSYSVVGSLTLTGLDARTPPTANSTATAGRTTATAADTTATAGPGTWTAVDGGIDPGRWQSLSAVDSVAAIREGNPPTVTDPAEQLSAAPGGLRMSFAAPSGLLTFGLAARVPDAVPAVVTPDFRAAPGTTGYQVGVPAGAPVLLTVGGVAKLLPRAGVRGVLVPWDTLGAAVPLGDDQVVANQVWLSRDAPADFPERLAAAGVTVTGIETPQARAESLARQGPALAVTFLLAGACAAAALAVGAAVVQLFLVARRRSFELAAMRALGFRPRTVAAAALAEQTLLAALAVLLGVALGVVAARLGLPSIPEFADGSTVPPLLVRIDPLRVAAVAVVLGALLGLGVAAGGAGLMSRAGPARLREGQA